METANNVGIVLSDLIKINYDRRNIYVKAYRDLKDQPKNFINILLDLEIQSWNNCKDLIRELHKLVTTPSFAFIKGKAYRIWSKFKTDYRDKDEVSIINTIDFNEEAADRAYRYSLETKIPENTKSLILNQLNALKDAHNLIKGYDESLLLNKDPGTNLYNDGFIVV